MIFRAVREEDLPSLLEAYRGIVEGMEARGFFFWNEYYPGAVFPADIKENSLYALFDGAVPVFAFALKKSDGGEGAVRWPNKSAAPLYLNRLAVNRDYQGRGCGALALEKAKETAKALGADALRLFVVQENAPACRL